MSVCLIRPHAMKVYGVVEVLVQTIVASSLVGGA